MDEISYSPAVLARKIGIHRRTLIRHLKQTGLIDQCYRSENNWLRIPYKLAEKISSAHALSIPEPARPPRKKRSKPERDATTMDEAPQRKKSRAEILTQPKDYNNLPQYYREIGNVLLNAGVTIDDLLQGLPLKREPDDEATTAERA